MDRILSKEKPADKNPKVSPTSVKVTKQTSSLGTRNAILSALKGGPMSARELAEDCDVKAGSSVFRSALRTLVRQNKIKPSSNTKKSVWSLVVNG